MRQLTVDRPGQLPVKEGKKLEVGLNEGVGGGEKGTMPDRGKDIVCYYGEIR
jgi:hypothetical protein